MPVSDEFQEVGHTGGKVTITVRTDPVQGRGYQLGYSHSRPGPMSLHAVYALPQGIACAGIKMGGIGDPWNAPPHPSCLPVFLASDSEGLFGHQCHACGGYWRCRGSAALCPYCAATGDKHMFLTEAQRKYVAAYCEKLVDAIHDGADGQHDIDMDAVADAVGQAEKPPFYYAEVSQQKKVTCEACGGFADILGRYCYCPTCGTRNDLAELVAGLDTLRQRVNAGGDLGSTIKDAVGAFDTITGRLVEELASGVPLSASRKGALAGRFHNLEAVRAAMKDAFDIDVVRGLSAADLAFAALMFHRRHVYEHLGGVADEKYIADSGDVGVRVGQSLRETREDVHRLIGLVARMGKNLHDGFHELFPPIAEPIKWHQDRQRAVSSR